MVKKISRLFALFIFVPLIAWSWRATGHRIVAAIAYQHLSKPAKLKVNQLTKVLYPHHSAEWRFVRISTLADEIKVAGDRRYDSWHYIDYPYRVGDIHLPASAKIKKPNVVWAIKYCQRKLRSPTLAPAKQANYLAFLVHFVGDAHQPMHCITRYSRRFPYGDRGGNRYRIDTTYADNLHKYWDQGLGLFFIKGHHYPPGYRLTLRLADGISKEYPQQDFVAQLRDTNPYTWTRRCFALAKRYAYNVPIDGVPSSEYIRQGQAVAKRQLALAGYRLAAVLNRLYAN